MMDDLPLTTEDALQPVFDCELFTGMEPRDIRRTIHCLGAYMLTRRKEEIVVTAGTPQEDVGIVLEGQVQVQKEDYDGHRLILAVFDPPQIFGEISAFSGSGVWQSTVIARMDSRVMMLPMTRLVQPCDQRCFAHAKLNENMLAVVAKRAMGLNRRIDYLKRKSMREKLSAFLYDRYHQAGNTTFMLELDRQSMAEYLNVSRPSMSRELGRMKEEGIIDFYRHAFTIRDVKALRRRS